MEGRSVEDRYRHPEKQVILHLPYLLFFLVFAKLGQAVRLAPGADASQKLLGLSEGFTYAFQSMWPGAGIDWLIGLCGAAIMRLAVYLKGKDAKSTAKCGIRLCPLGQQNGYCPVYGPETGKQHHSDADGGAYDVRQAEEPGQCPE